MKLPLSIKSSLLVLLFVLSSCSTVKYGEDASTNNYSNLQTGKNYQFTLRDGGEKQKMVFSRISDDQIMGFASKKDSTMVSIPKSSVSEVKDIKKASATIAGFAIGTAAAAALILSSSRAD
ncbi:hypothetical protein [Frigoriflavimonas asaccharolytica]|uniref:Putative aminopeptidase n=1 Tax=Frigoriflavimonas asaccharolytica TaxID=2735899 RepID=A0A8J8K8Q8_9FLAO|nr:hypothetical protein [Frigoriflavimonas asaccharolytica]NRS92192.1 putative aminopeptidase [Frigoriflavimonas asaccharolytica]